MDCGTSHTYIVSSRGRRTLSFYLVPVKDLSPHEEVINDLKEELMERMSNDNLLKDPIIADYENRLIIDGTHRAAVLKDMNIDYIVVLHFNYLDPNLKLYRWFRVYRGIREIPLEISELTVGKDVFEAEKLDEYPLYIIHRNVLNILSENNDIRVIMNTMRRVEYMFREYGYDLNFMSEDEVLVSGLLSGWNVLLGYRHISKEEVLEIHRMGQVLNHKSTRHVPPYRVVGIDIPLDYLYENNIDKAIKYLENIRLEYVGEKVFIDGRYYAEKIFKKSG